MICGHAPIYCVIPEPLPVDVSTKDDICNEFIAWILKTYQKNNKHVVCERGRNGQRHLHMLIQFEGKVKKRMFQTTLVRKMKVLHPDSEPTCPSASS